MADDEYAVIHLGVISGATDIKAHGINAKGQVVGEITISGKTQAFLWLPEDDYTSQGFSAGMNLLNDNFNGFAVSPDGAFTVVNRPDVDPDQARVVLVFPDADGGGQLQNPVRVGDFGFFPNAYNLPQGLHYTNDGRLLVADTKNRRVQTLSPQALSGNPKGIIVAGGGTYPGNTLWDATQINANFAYQVMNFQGLDRSRIAYLSEDTDQDIDGNGFADDIDAAVENQCVADLGLCVATRGAEIVTICSFNAQHQYAFA